MKSKLLFLIFLLGASTAFAQLPFNLYPNQRDNDKQLFMSVSLGVSVPLNYGTPLTGFEAIGTANAGLVADISAYLPMTRMLGFSALIRGSRNKFSLQNFPLSPTAAPNAWSMPSGNWGNGTVVAGPYFNLPFSNKVSFIARGMAGYAMTSSPILLESGAQMGAFGNTGLSRYDFSFAYVVGTTFKFRAGNRISVLANADFQNYQPQYINVNYMNGNTAVPATTAQKYRGTFNLSVGIARGF